MTAAQAILPLSLPSPAIPTQSLAVLARKRRREKMRHAANSQVVPTADLVTSTRVEFPSKGLPPKKRKFSADSCESASVSSHSTVGSNIPSSPTTVISTPEDLANVTGKMAKTNKAKDHKSGRKQMRYDPEVPMTKEEASAWRREARRVRNRESAAASRRKIRDRIEELEEEVEVWKAKYEAIMLQLQEQNESSTSDCQLSPVSPLHNSSQNSMGVPCPVTSSSSVCPPSVPENGEGKGQQHLIDTILGPAVS